MEPDSPTVANEQPGVYRLGDRQHDAVYLHRSTDQLTFRPTEPRRAVLTQSCANFIKSAAIPRVQLPSWHAHDVQLGSTQGRITQLVLALGLVVLRAINFHNEWITVRGLDQEVDSLPSTPHAARKRVQRGLGRRPAHCLWRNLHQPLREKHTLLGRFGIYQIRIWIRWAAVDQHARINQRQSRGMGKRRTQVTLLRRTAHLSFKPRQPNQRLLGLGIQGWSRPTL